MRGTRVLAVVAALGCGLSTGCSTMSNTEKGAGLGGLIGAGVGTAVGSASGNPRTGAVAGGLIGAGVGGLAGADADARERERADVRRAAAEAAAPAFGMNDVIQMTQQGVSEDVIINYVRQSGQAYRLSATDVTMLKQNQVGDRVINAMLSAQPRPSVVPARTVVVRETAPTVIYEPSPWVRPVYVAPPPPPTVGFTYIRRR